MATVGKLVAVLEARTAGFHKNMKRAGTSVDKFGDRMKKVGRYVAAFGVAAGAGALLVSRSLVKAASAAEEIDAKFRVVFGKTADAVESWSKDYSKATGFARSETKKWLATLQDTFVPLGYSREAAAGFSKQLVSLVGDLASFNNARPDDVLRDIQSAIVGNHETMRKYGVIITEETLKETAYGMGVSRNVKKLDSQQKVMARLKLIMDGTKDAQGDLARTANSYANQMRRLVGQWTTLKETLGKPFMEAAAKQLQSINKALGDIIANDPLMESMTDKIGKGFTVIGAAAAWATSIVKVLITAVTSVYDRIFNPEKYARQGVMKDEAGKARAEAQLFGEIAAGGKGAVQNIISAKYGPEKAYAAHSVLGQLEQALETHERRKQQGIVTGAFDAKAWAAQRADANTRAAEKLEAGVGEFTKDMPDLVGSLTDAMGAWHRMTTAVKEVFAPAAERYGTFRWGTMQQRQFGGMLGGMMPAAAGAGAPGGAAGGVSQGTAGAALRGSREAYSTLVRATQGRDSPLTVIAKKALGQDRVRNRSLEELRKAYAAGGTVFQIPP